MQTPIAYWYRLYNSFTNKVTDAFTTSKDVALEYDATPIPLYENRWIPVTEELPPTGKNCLLRYARDNGTFAAIVGFYQHKFFEEANEDYWPEIETYCDYCEETDTYYEPAGWYECCETEDYSGRWIGPGNRITHWMELPELPDV